MNYEKQTKVSFLDLGKIWSHMRSPFFRNFIRMDAEGKTDVAMVEKRYRRKMDDLATHVSLFGIVLSFFLLKISILVYQESKRRLYEFIYTIFEFLEPGSYKLTYIGRINYPNVKLNCFERHGFGYARTN